MKTILVPLLLIGNVCCAVEQPFESGLLGKVTIAEADSWMDGGSVFVSLRDEHGTLARMHYEQTLFDNPHNGQLSYRSPKTKKIYLAKGSPAEQALLHLLGAACANTFGTADVETLRSTARGRGGLIRDFERAAVASLFLQVESRKRKRTPTGTR